MMLLDCDYQPSRWCETWWWSYRQEGCQVPSDQTVSALVSMKPRDVFAETSGQFPVMFVSNRDIIFSEVPLSPNPTRPEAQR